MRLGERVSRQRGIRGAEEEEEEDFDDGVEDDDANATQHSV